jgi:hypothetical protein
VWTDTTNLRRHREYQYREVYNTKEEHSTENIAPYDGVRE